MLKVIWWFTILGGLVGFGFIFDFEPTKPELKKGQVPLSSPKFEKLISHREPKKKPAATLHTWMLRRIVKLIRWCRFLANPKPGWNAVPEICLKMFDVKTKQTAITCNHLPPYIYAAFKVGFMILDSDMLNSVKFDLKYQYWIVYFNYIITIKWW